MNEMTATKSVLLDEDQFDVLQELINIGVGRAADSLSQLVEARIQLCVPTIQLLEAEEAQEICSRRPNSEETIITQSFTGTIDGRVGLLLDQQSVVLLTRLLGDEEDFEEEGSLEQEGLLLEVGNIVLNGVMGSLSNSISDQLEYSIPELAKSNSIRTLLAENLLDRPSVLLADVRLHVEDSEIEGSIIVVFNAEVIAVALNQIIEQG